MRYANAELAGEMLGQACHDVRSALRESLRDWTAGVGLDLKAFTDIFATQPTAEQIAVFVNKARKENAAKIDVMTRKLAVSLAFLAIELPGMAVTDVQACLQSLRNSETRLFKANDSGLIETVVANMITVVDSYRQKPSGPTSFLSTIQNTTVVVRLLLVISTVVVYGTSMVLSAVHTP